MSVDHRASSQTHDFGSTQGLWRVTGQQVEAAAVAGEGQRCHPPLGICVVSRAHNSTDSPLVLLFAGANSEDVKGPHAALAVRLQQRDPGRSFVLGERLQYVLLPGFRTQVRALCSVLCTSGTSLTSKQRNSNVIKN